MSQPTLSHALQWTHVPYWFAAALMVIAARHVRRSLEAIAAALGDRLPRRGP